MRKFHLLFLASFCFSVHLALLTYINSSMLGRFGGSGLVSIAFTIGSAAAFIMLFLAPRAVRHIGLVKTTIISLLVSSFLLVMLASMTTAVATITLFVLYFSLNSVIIYLFDLFIEHYSKIESTGRTRGMLLSINSLGWIGAPLIAGMLSAHGFNIVYLLGGAIVLVTLIIITLSQRGFPEQTYERMDFRHALGQLRILPKIRRIVTLNLLLQFFFAWMVVYSPLYLQSIGFDWKSIGGMFSIMLVAFIIFQYPAGKLSDMVGETRVLRLALIIMAGATICFAYVTSQSFWVYAAILFMTRVGASTVEVCCDSYFFKHVTEANAPLVSLYRATLPIAYIIGPLSGALVLYFFSYKMLFLLLSGLLLLAMLYSSRLDRNY